MATKDGRMAVCPVDPMVDAPMISVMLRDGVLVLAVRVRCGAVIRSIRGGFRFGRLAGIVHRHRSVRQLPDDLSVEAIDIGYALAPVLLLRKIHGIVDYGQ